MFGGGSDDILVGGAGNDIIYGSAGADTLTGGSGADTFGFAAAGAGSVDTITDFAVGAGGDVLNISDLITGTVAGNEASYVSLRESNGNTIVSIDRDGGGSSYGFEDFVSLQGVTTQPQHAACERQHRLESVGTAGQGCRDAPRPGEAWVNGTSQPWIAVKSAAYRLKLRVFEVDSCPTTGSLYIVTAPVIIYSHASSPQSVARLTGAFL
jgi:hypothetical protein